MMVQDYLTGDIFLQTLKERLIAVLYGAPQPAETIDLAHAIDLRIAEFSGGHVSAEEFREHLRAEAGLGPIVTSAAQSAETTYRSLAVTTRRSMEFV